MFHIGQIGFDLFRPTVFHFRIIDIYFNTQDEETSSSETFFYFWEMMMTFEISTDLGPILILILKIEIKNLGEVDIFKNLKDSRKKNPPNDIWL